MRFLDLFWWFLDGDKRSSQIINENKQPVQQVQQQHKSDEAEMAEEHEEFHEEFFD